MKCRLLVLRCPLHNSSPPNRSRVPKWAVTFRRVGSTTARRGGSSVRSIYIYIFFFSLQPLRRLNSNLQPQTAAGRYRQRRPPGKQINFFSFLFFFSLCSKPARGTAPPEMMCRFIGVDASCQSNIRPTDGGWN